MEIGRIEYRIASRIPLNESIRNWKNQMEKAAGKTWFELASFGLGNFKLSSRGFNCLLNAYLGIIA